MTPSNFDRRIIDKCGVGKSPEKVGDLSFGKEFA